MEEEYFFLTINFQPDYDKDFKLVGENDYVYLRNGKMYRKRLLYDFGWGQEWGYVCSPEPTFKELIAIVENIPICVRTNPFYFLFPKMQRLNKRCWDNAFGAISVIMEDHVDELISFLREKIKTDYFEDKFIRQRFQYFRFDNNKAREHGICVGGTIKNRPYEDIFLQNAEWGGISQKLVHQVYK